MEAGRAAPGILRTLEGWQFDTATGSAILDEGERAGPIPKM